ncbi:Aerotolerance protein BatD [hydrothermal vent metagenome]|uniref:Aerotolerance protein BatD n=1 Tax=hydrothermal vent metagenome TaxID=652676 RepID=A0A3B0WFZ1_9ZZZZ
MNTIMFSMLRTLLFFSVFISATLQAANITVTASRNSVALDDSFHLIYEADSSVDDDPDFSPIYENFDVLNSSQSTNMRSANGSWSMKKTWDLSVIAKKTGKLTIPAIIFGTDISPAIQISVTNSSSPNSASSNGQSTVPAKIFLENSLDKNSGWLQSQYIYTVRLLRTVSISNASLTDPTTNDPDAIITKLSENNYQTTRNGIRYDAFERRYAIFPQKSGQLKIRPVAFEGRINLTQARTIFDQFRMSGQLKRLRSKTVSATVKAAPNNINLQDWLPAAELQLVEEWSDDIKNIKTGDPVTRTVTIAASGLTAVQLPDLGFDDIDGLKQYPDKPIVEDRTQTSGITGIKQMKVAIIPTTAGTYTLPEIKLQWWNTRTNKKEVAIIPEKVLTAIGSAASSNSIITTPKSTQTKLIQDNKKRISDEKGASLIAQVENSFYWKWLALAFATAWLLTLLWLLKKPEKNKRKDKILAEEKSISIKTTIAAVKKHAKNNDLENTRLALIEWAKLIYANDTITNLSQIANRCSPELAKEIRSLNESLYSFEKLSWGGSSLAAEFKNESSLISKKENNRSVLKPLYNN